MSPTLSSDSIRERRQGFRALNSPGIEMREATLESTMAISISKLESTVL